MMSALERVEDDEDDEYIPLPQIQSKQTAIDVTAEDLIDRLTVQNVADLVLLSMVRN